jgi:hypothetical protein
MVNLPCRKGLQWLYSATLPLGRIAGVQTSERRL